MFDVSFRYVDFDDFDIVETETDVVTVRLQIDVNGNMWYVCVHKNENQNKYFSFEYFEIITPEFQALNSPEVLVPAFSCANAFLSKPIEQRNNEG